MKIQDQDERAQEGEASSPGQTILLFISLLYLQVNFLLLQ